MVKYTSDLITVEKRITPEYPFSTSTITDGDTVNISDEFIQDFDSALERAEYEFLMQTYSNDLIAFDTYYTDDITLNKVIEIAGYGNFVVRKIRVYVESVKVKMAITAVRYT